MEIKPGSVVKLKSGGPEMTVSDSSNGYYSCVWFDKNSGEAKEKSFKAHVLALSGTGDAGKAKVVS